MSQGFYLRFFLDLGTSGFYVYYIVEIIIVLDYIEQPRLNKGKKFILHQKSIAFYNKKISLDPS